MGARHLGQRERGLTIESDSGSLEIQTLRKLPISRPKRKAKRNMALINMIQE